MDSDSHNQCASYKILSQIYKGDPRACAILSQHGTQIVGIRVSRNQNNRGSPGANITCIYRGLGVKMNKHKTPHGARRSRAHLLCVCFCVCGRQKPEYPNLSPKADDAITKAVYEVWDLPRISLELLQNASK